MAYIRDKYVDAIEGIAQREKVKPLGFVAHKIGAEATRRQCLKYALRHVVRHRQQHYRYDLYRAALDRALYRAAVYKHSDRLLLHLDMGCGPGLFTWVVSDIPRLRDVNVERYGYDHCREMVRLASDVWSEVGDAGGCSWHHDIGDLLAAALAGGPRYSGLLVTFGHVLAQTHASEDAINQFATVISHMTSEDSLVVAVDAKGASQDFRAGCESLIGAMEILHLMVDVHYSGDREFSASVRHR